MKMDVHIDRAAESLNCRDRAAPPIGNPAAPRTAALEAQERPDVDGEHGATEPVVPD
jgi:hypothetical protein